MIGELDDVDTMVTGFIIRPFVAAPRGADDRGARATRRWRGWCDARLADLLSADAAMLGDPGVPLLRYPLDGEDVWGATARILRTFSRVVRCALSPEGPGPSPGPAGADPGDVTPAFSPS